ncbi:hypothetical protein HQ50_08720 [Porphyromonas sp. COT-052 OH4946]|nr:hypothetical protein HQ50_08720 [Porphyromonas sp. COT-052 OH4946]
MLVLPLSLLAQGLTRAEALARVKNIYGEQCSTFDFAVKEDVIPPQTRVFSGKDFLLSPSVQSWFVFVDKEPKKGWTHSCEYVFVECNSGLIHRFEKSMAPVFDLVYESQTGGNISSLNIPTMHSGWTIVGPPNTQSHTYAVIISGGGPKKKNRSTYWNDCSYMYCTLKHKYQVPDKNIFVIMSDGQDPGEDLAIGPNSYISSPLDLDGDGIPDIKYPATKAAIGSVFDSLAKQLSPKDNLIIFVTDHGDKGDQDGESSIVLWMENEEPALEDIPSFFLQDYELKEMLAPINVASMVVVMGQCFSGGFVDDLQGENRIIMTASSSSQATHANADNMYEGFLYNWMESIAQMSPYGNFASTDLNNDGVISMEETRQNCLALGSDSETQQYSSIPAMLGTRTFINGVYDLYSHDSPKDTGREPETSHKMNYWNSNDLWIRNQNDSVEQHENPIYSQNPAFVYVKVHNRGTLVSSGQDKVVLSWTPNALGIDPANGSFGGNIGEIAIPQINPGDSVVLVIEWNTPNPNLFEEISSTEKMQFALFANITSSRDSTQTNYSGDLALYNTIKNNNNFICKKSNILSLPPSATLRNGEEPNINDVTVFLHSMTNEYRNYQVEFISEEGVNSLINECEVSMTLSPDLQCQLSEGTVEVVGMGSIPDAQGRFRIIDPHATLRGLDLSPESFSKIHLHFNFTEGYNNGNKYDYLVLLKDTNSGEIVDGNVVQICQEIRGSQSQRQLNFDQSEQSSPVQNLTYEIDGDQLTLKWEASETNGEILLVKEDFTEYDPVSLLPTGWTAIDADEDGNGWRAGGNSYLYDGLHVAISFSSWNGLADLNPDNYLITPEVSGANRITYLVTPGDYNWPDHYGVFISKAGTSAADFVHLFDEMLIAPSSKGVMKDGRWYQFQERELILPEGTKYVAFRHYDSSEMFAVVVTQVRVYGKASPCYNIYKDGSLLQANVEGTSFTTPLPAQTSEYCVRAVIDGVESDPACVTVEMTALAVPDAQTIEISGEEGRIRIATSQPETMRLFDLQGRMLLTGKIAGETTIAIAAGLYVVQVGGIRQKISVR